MMAAVGLWVMGIGLFFWFWGTLRLFSNRSVLWKLHGLGVSDTLGSILMICGLWMRLPEQWPLLLLAILCLALWGTMLGYVLAHCVTERRR